MARRFHNLDGLRGICAILVAVMHSNLQTGLGLLPSAHVVVDLFFVMSGFVISKAYDDRLRVGGYTPEFIARRYGRLMPMWSLGLLLGAAYPLISSLRHQTFIITLAALLPQFEFIPVPQGDELFTYNGPGWSLFCEIAVNIAYAFVALRSDRKRLGLVIAFLAVTLCIYSTKFNGLAVGQNWSDIDGGMVRSGFGFSVGVWLARYLHVEPTGSRWTIIIPLLVVLVACSVRPPNFTWAYDTFVIVVVMPAVVLMTLRAAPINEQLLEALGALSYPMYAIHRPILMALFIYRGLTSHAWNHAPFQLWIVALTLAVTLAISLWLGKIVDPPLQRRLTRLLVSLSAFKIRSLRPS